MDADNFRKRVLHKIAISSDCPKVTFQVTGAQLRRWPQHMGSV